MPPKKSGKNRKTSKSTTSKKNKADTASVDSGHEADTNKRRRSSSVGSTASSGSDVGGPMSKFQDFDVEQAIKEVEQKDEKITETNATDMQDINEDNDVLPTNSELESNHVNYMLSLQQNDTTQTAQCEHSNNECDNGLQHNVITSTVEEHNEQQIVNNNQKSDNNYVTINNNIDDGDNGISNNNVDGTVVDVQPEEVVSLAAIAALNIPRTVEAQNGLLKEPDAPRADIPRVTRDGESAPPLPTELMQLLSAEEILQQEQHCN